MPRCAECEHAVTLGAQFNALCRKQGNKEIGLHMDASKCPDFSRLEHIIGVDTRQRGAEIGGRPPVFADEVKKSDVSVDAEKMSDEKYWG